MTPLILIAREKWRLMRRNRVAVIALALVLLLSTIAAVTSVAQQAETAALRAHFQQEADAAFAAQPSRHPHRMVHFGQFAFKPVEPLAAFDPGVDPFTGTAIFLEGHRQNSANFGDVRQSSLLVRFGQLTPAFVLQILAPLILIFLGFGAVARERDGGTLVQLRAHGMTIAALLTGKAIALGAIGGLILVPAGAALAWMVVVHGASLPAATLLLASYTLYLAIWVGGVILASAIMRQARSALILLVGAWLTTAILVPRMAPDIAGAVQSLPTRLESEVAVTRDYRAIGDSHDPNDPHFAAFRTAVLKKYNVARVEDLPVNYAGLLAVEGERLSAELFARYADQLFAQEARQSDIMNRFALVSPTAAIRQASMALADTDRAAHRRFLGQAEAFRYDLVQRLNMLEATDVTAENDAKGDDPATETLSRVSQDHWRSMPTFHPRPSGIETRAKGAGPALGYLVGWLLAIGACLLFAGRRMGNGR
ncbi:ABC transporter permease [Sphingomonas montana]|uniref:ABC transporter permease n=1 Tax=Sphingomonas montana TaxID=1843236 RepID=UPI00096DFE1B|nr:DUF3526 domain-containing protein [Sphingomonas montana]